MQIDHKTYSLCEAVADLVMDMEDAIARNAWQPPPDSRERVALCIKWALEFEAQNADRVWDGEYLEEIHQFFLRKISQ